MPGEHAAAKTPTASVFDRWWFVAMPARRLAMLRILVGGYAFFYLLGRLPALFGVMRYGEGQFRPVGPVSLLSAPLSPAMVVGLIVLTLALAAAFALGWRFRWLAPLYAALLVFLLSYRNSWGMVFHTENLLVLHVGVLALARSADAWSFDARSRSMPPEHGRYGWPVRLMCAVTVVTYLIAGYAKLRHAGLGWVTSDTLLNFVAYDNIRKAELGAGYSVIGGFMAGYPALFPPLAAFSLAVELGAPLALIGSRIGRVWAAAAWSFHLGVLVVMFILFHYQLLGFAYAPFFSVEKLGDRVEARVRRYLSSRRASSG